jgi:putative aldouronate transport system substrate-binding protein
MNAKKITVYFTLITMLLATSCSNGDTQSESADSSATETASTSSEDSADGNGMEVQYGYDGFGFTRFDIDSDTEELKTYDGKTKLVYLTIFDTQYLTTEEDPRIFDEIHIENAVNEYLDEKGYDFYVDFINNGEYDYKTGELHQNIDLYKQMLDDGEQVDIINTGTGLSFFDGYGDTYNYCLKQDWLEPLNDYLDTDLGKKLYAQFGDIVWKQTTDDSGVICAVPTLYSLASPLVLEYNDQMVQKYSVDPDSVSSLSDLEPYLEKMAADGIAGLYVDPTCEEMYQLAGFCTYNGIYINAETGKAENIFENSKAIEYMKLLSDYSQKGYIAGFKSEENDTTLCSIAPSMPMSYDSSHVISKGYLQDEEINQAVGITKNSQHKDEAFELLVLLNTDSELAEIIYNGTEGRNYSVNDGEKCLNKNCLPFYREYETMTNPIIASANSQDNPNKQNDMQICWDNSEVSPFYKLEISDELKAKLENIAAINEKFYTLLQGSYGEYESLDDALAAANSELDAAGVDEVLGEINEAVK